MTRGFNLYCTDSFDVNICKLDARWNAPAFQRCRIATGDSDGEGVTHGPILTYMYVPVYQLQRTDPLG